MSIWDRLGDVIKSYVNDFGEGSFHGNSPKSHYRQNHSDPDFNAAYEELDDFLQNKGSQKESKEQEEPVKRPPPKELWEDFEELGLSREASFDECKAAYKKLLKIHHPDKHSRHPDNMRKATEKSARVNAAYKRLENWFKLLK